MVGELPDVITADMLRARKSKTINLDEIEIPAELLVGLDEEDEEFDDEFDEEAPGKAKGKGKAKPKPKAKKSAKPKRRRPAFEDDDFDEFA